MRQIFVVLALVLIGSTAFAQTQGKIYIDVEELTPQQVKDAMTKQDAVAKAERWVEVGKGLGAAFREGLSAVTDETGRFSETKVGKFTMLMIAYKIVGEDIIQFIIGMPLLVVVTVIFIWVLRSHCIVHKIAIKREGRRVTEYQVWEPEEDWYPAVAALIYIGMVGICATIIFV